MPPLEVDPLGLVVVVAAALLLVGLSAYQLGHREGAQAERERLVDEAQRERDTGRWE